MEIEVSKSGLLTLKYNNKYIHSKYDPEKESKQFINGYKEIIDNDIIVVYGIGLGYHLNALLEVVSKEIVIYVFEYNLSLVKYCKEVNKELFQNPQIKFILKSNKNFYSSFSSKIKEVKEIIIHKPSLETIKEKNLELYQLLEDYNISKIAVEKFSKVMKENEKENRKVNALHIKYIINELKENIKDYVVVSAGSSLDSEIVKLKLNRDKFKIFTVGSALRTLMKNSIIPDAIVIVDPQDIVSNQLEGYEHSRIPLCFLETASKVAATKYQGPKYIFGNDGGEDSLKTGKTVAISALDLAIKCGARNVIMIGQDLACVDGRSHTSTFKEIYNKEDYGGKVKSGEIVKSYDGKLISTTKGYLVFKRQIERLINDNQNVNFFNCSKGVYIEGANHLSFNEYLKEKEE